LLVEKTVTYCSRAGVVVATEALIPGGKMDITLHNLDKLTSFHRMLMSQTRNHLKSQALSPIMMTKSIRFRFSVDDLILNQTVWETEVSL
jgi:hypothetical protein